MKHPFYGKGHVERMILIQPSVKSALSSILEEEIANEIEKRHLFMKRMFCGKVDPQPSEPLTAEMIERAASMAECRINAMYRVDPFEIPVVVSPAVPKDSIMFIDNELRVRTEEDRDNLIERIGRGDFSSIITVMKVKVGERGFKIDDDGRACGLPESGSIRNPGEKRIQTNKPTKNADGRSET